MKLKFVTSESKRTRGGSKLWYRDTKSGRVRWTRPYYWITSVDIGWWWSSKLKKWVHTTSQDRIDEGDHWCIEYPELCLNHRKFKRLVKKWSAYLPNGVQFELSGPLVGGPKIIGTISNSRRQAIPALDD